MGYETPKSWEEEKSSLGGAIFPLRESFSRLSSANLHTGPLSPRRFEPYKSYSNDVVRLSSSTLVSIHSEMKT